MLSNLLKTSFVILSTVLLGGLLNSSSVNAQSYTDIPVDYNLTMDIYGSEDNIDLSYLWYPSMVQALENRCNTYPSQPVCNDEILQNMTNGDYNWTLSKPNSTQLYIHISPKNIELNAQYDEEYNQWYINFDNATRYLIFDTVSSSNDCFSIPVENSNNLCLSNQSQDSTSSVELPIVLSTAYINYPPDYNGELIRDTLPTQAQKIGVSIRGSVVEDIIQIEWYNDLDNPPPDNAEGMYLVLHNSNFDEIPPECSNQNIQEWRHNLTEIAVFNPVPCYGMWYVQSYYTSDAGGQNIIPETDKTILNLRIDGGSFYFDYEDVEYDEDGSIISPPISGVNMMNCVSFVQSLPFVEFDYQGCFTNIQKFIGIASTNNSNVSKQFNELTIPAHQGCGSFTKIDEFLHISTENNWICPQLTDGLRQPITLFVVFLLYLGTMFGWFMLMSGRR